MPYSDDSNRDYFRQVLNIVKPEKVLDVGPGAGAYGKIIRQQFPTAIIDCVEIWQPYVDQFNLDTIYDNITIGDMRRIQNFDADLVIFGDVLEHVSREDARRVFETAYAQARHIFFSIPIIHYPQHSFEGNPHETHVEENWTHEDILATFPEVTDYRCYEITGSYWTNVTESDYPRTEQV